LGVGLFVYSGRNMDKQAILTGRRLMKKADLDWLSFENQSGEWSVRTCEAFEKHLKRLQQGFNENFWYGYPERSLLNG